MSNLHKLAISSPDGVGYNTAVLLDGEQIYPVALTLHFGGGGATTAVIEFEVIAVEFDGIAEVTGE